MWPSNRSCRRLAHRHRLYPLVHEQLARRIQDLRPQILLMLFPSRNRLHSEPPIGKLRQLGKPCYESRAAVGSKLGLDNPETGPRIAMSRDQHSLRIRGVGRLINPVGPAVAPTETASGNAGTKWTTEIGGRRPETHPASEPSLPARGRPEISRQNSKSVRSEEVGRGAREIIMLGTRKKDQRPNELPLRDGGPGLPPGGRGDRQRRQDQDRHIFRNAADRFQGRILIQIRA